MSDARGDSAPHEIQSIDRETARRFQTFTGGFWRGANARQAWLWTVALAGFLVLKLGVDVANNTWNRWFFDALERRDAASAGLAVLAFGLLVACIAAVGVGIVISRETLQVRWREWCTSSLLDMWLTNQRFYKLSMLSNAMPNPEYRISDDVRMATEPLTDFAIGLFTALLAATTFAGILWSVGGSMDISIGATVVTIPAFMVFGAIFYGVTASALIPIVGKRLAGVAAAKNESEALFRADMIRLRENAEGIVLAGGDQDARTQLHRTYAQVVRQWLALVRQHGNVTWVMNASSAMVPVVPLILCAPKYLAGQLTLGEVMQLASAFVQVQMAIAWLVDNYSRVAEWFASARRIVELVDAFESIERPDSSQGSLLQWQEAETGDISLRNVSLSDQTGRAVIEKADVEIRKGQHIFLSGESGSGKSVLMRALAGLWPWGKGSIAISRKAKLGFVSRTTFMPTGRLRDALTYPAPPETTTTEQLRSALIDCGLPHLADRLDVAARWAQSLSAGEQQRIAIARLLVQKPDIIILEDAVSAFVGAERRNIVELLFRSCDTATIINLGGGESLKNLFARHLVLQRTEGRASTLCEIPAAVIGSDQATDARTDRQTAVRSTNGENPRGENVY